MIGLRETADLLRRHDHILICSHLRPDGDCLGSTIGLLLALRQMGKTVAAYNVGPIGSKWAFLPHIDEVRPEFPAWTPSFVVTVDCGSRARVSDTFAPTVPTLNIDHHLTNTLFGDFNYIDIEACAVGEQIYWLLAELGVEITPAIALGLYTSILTDTGSFRYSNTTPRALRSASELVEAGADAAVVSMAVYESRTRGEVELMARAYASTRYEFDGVFCWAELRGADYAAAGGWDHEPEGLASDLRAVEGVEVSCLFQESPDGTIRAGFRGKGKIDCSAIAAQLGGGGHFNASGAVIKNAAFDEARDRVLAVIRRATAEYLAKR